MGLFFVYRRTIGGEMFEQCENCTRDINTPFYERKESTSLLVKHSRNWVAFLFLFSVNQLRGINISERREKHVRDYCNKSKT